MNVTLPDLCDEYSELITVLEPLFTNYGGRSAFGGQIATIKCFEDNSLVAQRVEEQGAGQVLVVDGGGSLRCGLFGDNLANKAAQNGWSGVVVYGCIRDVDIIRQIDVGVQALNTNPLRSIKKDVGERDIAVTFAGATFRPGEFVYADNNGIIVSSKELPT